MFIVEYPFRVVVFFLFDPHLIFLISLCLNKTIDSKHVVFSLKGNEMKSCISSCYKILHRSKYSFKWLIFFRLKLNNILVVVKVRVSSRKLGHTEWMERGKLLSSCFTILVHILRVLTLWFIYCQFRSCFRPEIYFIVYLCHLNRMLHPTQKLIHFICPNLVSMPL